MDLRIGRRLVEFDGKVKHQRPDPSRKPMSPEDVLSEEKKRQDWLCGFKLGMSRLVWSDVWGPGRAQALRRLERELAETEARFGTSIDDLAPYVLTRPPRAA